MDAQKVVCQETVTGHNMLFYIPACVPKSYVSELLAGVFLYFLESHASSYPLLPVYAKLS